MLAAGVDVRAIMDVLGHWQISTLETYAHVLPIVRPQNVDKLLSRLSSAR